jgi:hypothetical protein
MDFQILTYNNQVGIVYDAILLNDLLLSQGFVSSIRFLTELNNTCKSTVGIWIQNFDERYLSNFKINIFFINEEWVDDYYLSKLKNFDIVVCKTKYAQTLLKSYCNPVVLPFISRNLLDTNIPKNNNFLHFKGKSIQKNTELILQQSVPITLIDSDDRYKPNSNFTHINRYQTNDQLIYLLNSHTTHLCISLYESWGHYFYEGLSTGAEIICSDLPAFIENTDTSLVHVLKTKVSKNYDYVFDADNYNNKFTLRQSFYVDPNEFKNKLTNFEPIGKENERIIMYNDLMFANKKRLKEFFVQFK